MKKLKQYSNGGAILQSLAPLANLIPGIGQVAAPVMGIIGGLINNEETKPPVQTVKMNYTNDPYKMSKGGILSTFKQFNAPTHENGGQPINNDGQVDFKNPTREIEGTETKYTYSKLPNKYNQSYVFSDKNGTSELTRDVMNKYKNKNVDKDFLSRTAMELEFNKVENLNELIKSQKEEIEMGGGGNIVTRRKEGEAQNNSNVFDKVLSASHENLEQLGNGDLLGTPIQLGNHLGQGNSDYFTNYSFSNRIQQPVVNTLPSTTNLLQTNNTLPDIPNVRTNPNYGSLITGVLKDIALPKVSNGDVSDIITGGLAAFDVTRALTEKPEEVNPRMTDYSRSDEKMYSMNTDMTQMQNSALNANNQAVQQINDGTLSQSQRQSRLQGVYGNLGNTFANIALQQQQQQNQILGQQGQYEANKAQDISNHLIASDDKKSMNKAVTNQLKDVARQTLNSFAKEQSEKQFAKDQFQNALTQARLKTQDGFALLNKMVSNFGMNGSKEWQTYLTNPSPENEKALENAIKIKLK